MKITMTVVATVLSLTMSTAVRAQDDGTPILSQSCFEAAKLRAMDTIPAPELTAAATFTMTNVKIIGSSHFDFSNASASAWIYTFRSHLDDRTAAVLAYRSKTTGNCVALELPADSAEVMHERIDENVIQSDSLVYALAQNNTFVSIAVQYPTLSADTLLLVNADETNSDLFPPGSTVWIVQMHYKDGEMVCVYDASHRSDAICNAVQTSVLDEAKHNATVLCYPNPASDFAYMRLPEDNPTIQSVRVLSVVGDALSAGLELGTASDGANLVLPVSSLANGTYYVRIVSSLRSYTVPLEVIH